MDLTLLLLLELHILRPGLKLIFRKFGGEVVLLGGKKEVFPKLGAEVI